METHSSQINTKQRSIKPITFPKGKISDVTARRVFSKLGEMTEKELKEIKKNLETEQYAIEAYLEASKKAQKKLVAARGSWKYDEINPEKRAQISKEAEKETKDLSEEKKRKKLEKQALLATKMTKIKEVLKNPSKANKTIEELKPTTQKLPLIKATTKQEKITEKPKKLKTEPAANDKKRFFIAAKNPESSLSLFNRIRRHLFTR